MVEQPFVKFLWEIHYYKVKIHMKVGDSAEVVSLVIVVRKIKQNKCKPIWNDAQARLNIFKTLSSYQSPVKK